MAGFKKNNPGCTIKNCCDDTNPPIVSVACCAQLIPAHLVLTYPAIAGRWTNGTNLATAPGWSSPLDYDATGFAGAGWYGCGPTAWEAFNAHFGFGGVCNCGDAFNAHPEYTKMPTTFFLACSGGHWVLTPYFYACSPFAARGFMAIDCNPCTSDPAHFSPSGGLFTPTPYLSPPISSEHMVDTGTSPGSAIGTVVCSPFFLRLITGGYSGGPDSVTIAPA